MTMTRWLGRFCARLPALLVLLAMTACSSAPEVRCDPLILEATSPAGRTVTLTWIPGYVRSDRRYRLPPMLSESLEQSGRVHLPPSFAALPDDEKVRLAEQYAALVPGYQVEKNLDEKNRKGLEAYRAARPDFVDPSRLHIWLLTIAIASHELERAGYEAEPLVTRLREQAAGGTREVGPVITVAELFEALGSSSLTVDNALLAAVFRDLPKLVGDYQALLEVWRTGSRSALTARVLEASSSQPGIADAVEARWATLSSLAVDRIVRAAERHERQLALVYPRMLLGTYAVPAQLEQRGWTVERIVGRD